jgi:hypothetical protein
MHAERVLLRKQGENLHKQKTRCVRIVAVMLLQVSTAVACCAR